MDRCLLPNLCTLGCYTKTDWASIFQLFRTRPYVSDPPEAWAQGPLVQVVCAPSSKHLPPCPQVEETAAFWWYNQSEAPMKTAVTRSASFVSFRQCWDFLAAEDDLSLPALFHGRSQKWRSVVCSTRLFPTLQFNLSHSSSLFYKFYILGPFSWGKITESQASCLLSLLLVRMQNILASLLSTPFPTQSWVLVFLLGLLYTKETFHTLQMPDLLPSIMYLKSEIKYLKLILDN